MDAALLSVWSSRRHAIEHRQRELVSVFQAEHHRAPTTIESLALAQQANLETRPAKHEPRSEAEQRDQWLDQASALYAGGAARGDERIAKLVTAALGERQGRTPPPGRGALRQGVAGHVLQTLESSRATWQVWHVKAEALRQARAVEVPLSQLDQFVRDVERHVLDDLSVPVGVPPDLGEPDVLRRPDGQSAYVLHGSRTYTSRTILAAEESLLALGLRRDGVRVPAGRVDLNIGYSAEDGIELDRSQAAMVGNLATSGCRLQVALAPAGSGKTTALAVLAHTWEARVGNVVGLAPTAVAADELGRATGVQSETLARFLHDRDRAAPNIGPKTLVLIDEAAMAGTCELAAAVALVVECGGSVRLVGDDQQLSAVAAGGIFRDLTEQGRAHGSTATLTDSTGSPTRQKVPPPWLSETAIPPPWTTTSSTAASTPTVSAHRARRPTRHGRPTRTPARRPCCWPRPATRCSSSTVGPDRTDSTPSSPRPAARWTSPTAPVPAEGTSSSPAGTTEA